MLLTGAMLLIATAVMAGGGDGGGDGGADGGFWWSWHFYAGGHAADP